MTQGSKPVPATVYILADNLDTALAAGEDLLKSELCWDAGDACSPEELTLKKADERRAVEGLRALEMVLVARVMKSRDSAGEIAKSEPHLKPIAKLYVAGTALLEDAVAEFGDATKQQFDEGGVTTAYLRSRGLLPEDAPAPHAAETIRVSEGFRVCGRVPLGALLDLVATVLDTLDTHYGLYDGEARPGSVAAERGKTRIAEATV